MAEPLTGELLARAAALGSATIHEAAGRIGALPAGLRPVDPSWRVAGPARTVAGERGDNLAIHHAIALAAPGDVLVVATGDDAAMWGYWGEIMSTAAAARALGALVLQGGSRDHAALPSVGFPVFSLGSSIRGTGKHQTDPAGRVGVPVRIGDVEVRDGDLVVGDIDGVVVIPASRAAEAVAAGVVREEHEADVMHRLAAGETTIEVYGLP
jgi:4-hydroxy-4-methyl-2-oxoglutarate aldolase